ncbi:Cell division protein ZipA [Bordetella sputigena]|uniref:cell division protein ZipA C-terminal FtsZ-binding domain-containing protein n=1 Tax=Bordetella sputigena TaxID=1416810 RepID=UPI0039F08A7A
MSDLQIGLIVLGVLLILMVLGFNWWQDRRVRRKMQAHFPSNEHDPLLGTAAHEGAASHGAAYAGQPDHPGHASHSKQAPQRREPGFGVGGSASDAAGAAAHAAAAASPAAHADGDDGEEADPACEVVIEVTFAEPVRGGDLLPVTQSMRSAGRKPMRVFGQTDDQRHRARLRGDERYGALQVAVLLANRTGPLTAIEWSQAWARAQDLGERFDAAIEGPDQQAVLEQAARLDDTCAALDTQVGLTLLLGSAQPAAEVLAIARDLGFIHDGPRLVWMSDVGLPRFTLTRGDGAAFDAGVGGVERLNLLLDVPCSPPDDRAFGRMVDVGRQLAQRLRAELVDDQGKPLADASVAVIDERLQVLFSQLEQAGLRAGSPRALRVFS